MSGNVINDVCAGIINYTLIDDNNCVFNSVDIQIIEPEKLLLIFHLLTMLVVLAFVMVQQKLII